jgi:hypothetical protein
MCHRLGDDKNMVSDAAITPGIRYAIDVDRLAMVPGGSDNLPKGWLFDVEARILYSAAQNARGPIIEVGSWIGRSTCALAYGVRDNSSGRQVFDVFDYGIAGIEEFIERFGEDPRLAQSSADFLQVIMHPGGTPALLKQNLSDRKLDRQINLISFGDFRAAGMSRKYQVAFCDACHGVEEIRANVPALYSMMDSKNYVMVFDDVLLEEHLEVIRSIIHPEIALRLCEQVPSKIAIACSGDYTRLFDWIVPA